MLELNRTVLIIFVLALIWISGNSTVASSKLPDDTDSLIAALDHYDSGDTMKVKVYLKLVTKELYVNPQQARSYAEKALALSESLDFESGKATSWYRLGIAHNVLGNYDISLDFLMRALSARKKLGQEKGVSACLSSIGTIYYYQSSWEPAIDYYKQAIALDRELGDTAYISTSLNNVGIVYRKLGDYQQAMSYFNQVLIIDSLSGDSGGVAAVMLNIGNIHMDQDNYPKCLEYYDKALSIYRGLGQNERISMCLNNIASVHSLMGDHQRSIRTLHECLELAIASGAKARIKDARENLSNVYATTGQYKLAYENYKLYSAIKDSMFNVDKSKEIGKLEAAYEFEKAEDERVLAVQVKSQKEKAERDRRDNLQYSGILIFLVFLGAGIMAMGKLAIPVRLAEGMVFFTFLLFFEFLLVLLDPYIELYSGGAPAYKLLLNAILAGMIFPLHSFFESRLKSRIRG